MRGRFRAFCVAAGAFALFANLALAESAATPAQVSLRLGDVSLARSAESYLDGTPFAAATEGAFGSASVIGVYDPATSFSDANGPPAPRSRSLRDVAARISLSPALALDLGYQLDDAGQFNTFDAGDAGSRFDGLFLSGTARGETYAPFDNTNYAGATLKLSDNFALHVGDASSTRDRNVANENPFATLSRPVDAVLDFGAQTANTLMAGVSLKDSDWGGVDLTASHALEQAGVLDNSRVASLSSDTLNVSAHLQFGNGWVTTASYGESLTKLDIKPSALALSSPVELRQTGYAISIAKHGVFGDDALGLSVSRPVDPEAASGAFATVASPVNQPVFIGPDHLLADQKSETDIELGYTTSFSDSFALQTNAAYEMNFQGQSGTNAVQLLSRAKIKF